MTALPLTPPSPAEEPGLHPRPLRRRWVRLSVAGVWVVGAAAIGVDALVGPFNAALFVPGALLCLASGVALRWSYRQILALAPTPDDLDEREALLRARTYRAAYGLLALLLLLLLFPSMFVLSGSEHGGWRLKELAYLLPPALLWAPGAAAASCLPDDTGATGDPVAPHV